MGARSGTSAGDSLGFWGLLSFLSLFVLLFFYFSAAERANIFYVTEEIYRFVSGLRVLLCGDQIIRTRRPGGVSMEKVAVV